MFFKLIINNDKTTHLGLKGQVCAWVLGAESEPGGSSPEPVLRDVMVSGKNLQETL